MKIFLLVFIIIFLVSCSSITPIGTIGPNKLQVYAISSSDFLSANRMLIVLDKKGNVATATGGTVSGAGTVGLQTASSLVSAGAIYYGAKAIQKGVQNANVKVNGIPSRIRTDNHFKLDDLDGKREGRKK